VADQTAIEWCDATLNLWWGCTKVSEGCTHCYAEQLSDQRYKRLSDDEIGAKWNALEMGVHWVIVGGESGPNARPMHPDWARSLRGQCRAAGVPFFMKQMGGVRKPFPEIPADLICREYPNAASLFASEELN